MKTESDYIDSFLFCVIYVCSCVGSHDERPVMTCDGHTSNVMSIGMYCML